MSQTLWVSVEEMLPPQATAVLIAYINDLDGEPSIEFAELGKDGWHLIGDGDHRPFTTKVYHWTPLPDVPAELSEWAKNLKAQGHTEPC